MSDISDIFRGVNSRCWVQVYVSKLRVGFNLEPLKNLAVAAVCRSKINLLAREPVIGLIKWLRPKGLKVCSYVEKCAKFKNQTLKKIGWYTKVL